MTNAFAYRDEDLGSLPEPGTVLLHADLKLDPGRYRAWRGDRPVRLSSFQVELLQLLMQRPGHLFTREELARTIWSGRHLEMANVRTCFRRLRQALNASGERELVHNVPGRGYALDLDQEASAG